MPDQHEKDSVDLIVDAWNRERPELDFTPLHVLSRVWRLAKELDQIRRSSFRSSGLDPWEFDVLSALRRAGKPYQLSPKALLEQTLVSSGTMTNRIDRLVERELVHRKTDPHDGRGILVQMSATGLNKVDAAISQLVRAERTLLLSLTTQEQKQLAALLRTLASGINQSPTMR